MYYGYFDPTYMLVIIGFIISSIASAKVNSTFSRYSRVPADSRMTGAQAARRILDCQGLTDVSIEHIRGNLTDHYDPRGKVLRLSDATYGSNSVAAVGVAAHECGHAVQHSVGYVPLKVRSALVPAANFGSKLGIPLCILGMFLGMNQMLIQIGIWVFAIAVLFQIVTLPVEFNASRRALVLLDQDGILCDREISGTKKVLKAAAMTYVAAAAASILQLLRLVILFGGRDRD